MKMHYSKVSVFIVAVFGLGVAHAEIQLDKIKLPDGFKIRIFAKDISNARSMTLGKSRGR